MLDLTPEQLVVLERLIERGFTFVAFPLYASKIGVRKGNCATLLDPVPGGLRIFGEPSYLLNGNLSVRAIYGEETQFVWKQMKLPATPERLEELRRFSEEVEELLMASA